uniref:UFSP1/2/DUB catalytic domain-containing protein n=1 Tax=Kwoniella dejecticola CBS 10117 TaxID=1296121 RepID=A0A1A5ZZC7_9TREE|nr:uncharacterized protein I303_06694 [Kwoniella dejecticola CBS 10117]OBR83135.1 hypothetical protein I303_06694 [Kwoniella dejecticola CBS 10117]
MSTCPVCGETQNADQGAFAYHVNSHFEAGPSTATPPPIPLAADLPGERHTAEDICPICDFPLSFLSVSEAQTHVNLCLDGESSLPSPHNSLKRPRSSDFRDGGQSVGADTQEHQRDYDYDYDFSVASSATLQNGRNLSEGDEAVDEEWEGTARPGGWMDWAGKKVQRGDEWWDPIHGPIKEIPSNFSPGVIPVLAQTLRKASQKGITRRAVLCRDITHIKGIWKFDMGWGCGYRNCLMSLSSLLSIPTYQTIFDRQSNGAQPGVRRVQGWIREAWEEGFDPEGRKQLKGKILGTRKWIGPSDLYAMFSYKGIPMTLADDFPKPQNPKDGSRAAHIALQKWVIAYFGPTGYSPNIYPKSAFDVMMRTSESGVGRGEVVRVSQKFPLILQHNGHSRTIIGFEENARGDVNLLLFDPGRSMPKDTRSAGIANLTQTRQDQQQAASPSLEAGHSLSSKVSKPSLLKKRSSSISNTHESKPFSRPYTNGRAEIDYSSFDPDLDSHANGAENSNAIGEGEEGPALHPRGGFALEEDEELTAGGWVRKKFSRTTNTPTDSAGGNGMSGGQAGQSGNGSIAQPLDTPDTLKTLNYFRVNLGTLSRHTEYQILAFTGGPILTRAEREKRKKVTSTTIRADHFE